MGIGGYFPGGTAARAANLLQVKDGRVIRLHDTVFTQLNKAQEQFCLPFLSGEVRLR
jgi:hypothetical protein